MRTIKELTDTYTREWLNGEGYGEAPEPAEIVALCDATRRLRKALDSVQLALANWRDGQDEVLDGMNLEEVKYCIVDPALEEREDAD